jgi:hypothetical protein
MKCTEVHRDSYVMVEDWQPEVVGRLANRFRFVFQEVVS